MNPADVFLSPMTSKDEHLSRKSGCRLTVFMHIRWGFRGCQHVFEGVVGVISKVLGNF
jgi:hypothetical protein